jgi:hypothetical protein
MNIKQKSLKKRLDELLNLMSHISEQEGKSDFTANLKEGDEH